MRKLSGMQHKKTMANWVDLTVEQTLDASRPVCDAHHHLWDYPGSLYLLEEFSEDANNGHNIRSSVFMECATMYRKEGDELYKPVGETEFIQSLADKHPQTAKTKIALGIVGFANLQAGDAIKPVLEAHVAASPDRFRGIRHAAGYDDHPEVRNSHSNPPPGLYLRDDFRTGFAWLEKMNLSFDAWMYHTQFSDFIDLVKTFPNTIVVLDHFGGLLGIGPYADQREAIFERWQSDIETLGQYPNVYAKLGGLNMKICGFGWHKKDRPPGSTELADATARYYHHVIKHFGASRCMFESNFPVDKVSCSYNVLWNAFKRIAQDYSDEEKNALFYDTAHKVYRLAY